LVRGITTAYDHAKRCVFTLKNGRIVSERRLYEYAGLLMQLGILKTRNV
jgi:hypothetical protein